MSKKDRTYTINLDGNRKWNVLFNSSFGFHENIEDLATELVNYDIHPDEISNLEAFYSQGVDYKSIYNLKRYTDD
jgi:hypothetical protein